MAEVTTDVSTFGFKAKFAISSYMLADCHQLTQGLSLGEFENLLLIAAKVEFEHSRVVVPITSLMKDNPIRR